MCSNVFGWEVDLVWDSIWFAVAIECKVESFQQLFEGEGCVYKHNSVKIMRLMK